MAIRAAATDGRDPLSHAVAIQAGPSLKPLWGKVILVDQARVAVGKDGHLSVAPHIAKRLLAQSGWARYVAPTPGDGARCPGATVKPEPPPAPIAEPARRGRKKKGR